MASTVRYSLCFPVCWSSDARWTFWYKGMAGGMEGVQSIYYRREIGRQAFLAYDEGNVSKLVRLMLNGWKMSLNAD